MNAICERLVGNYNTARPHQSITQHVSDGHRDTHRRATVTNLDATRVYRRSVLGGLINEYAPAA